MADPFAAFWQPKLPAPNPYRDLAAGLGEQPARNPFSALSRTQRAEMRELAEAEAETARRMVDLNADMQGLDDIRMRQREIIEVDYESKISEQERKMLDPDASRAERVRAGARITELEKQRADEIRVVSQDRPAYSAQRRSEAELPAAKKRAEIEENIQARQKTAAARAEARAARRRRWTSRMRKGGLVGLVSGAFAGGAYLASRMAETKARANAGERQALQAQDIINRTLAGEAVSPEDRLFMDRFMGDDYATFAQVGDRVAAGDEEAAEAVRRLQSGEIITPEDIAAETEDLLAEDPTLGANPTLSALSQLASPLTAMETYAAPPGDLPPDLMNQDLLPPGSGMSDFGTGLDPEGPLLPPAQGPGSVDDLVMRMLGASPANSVPLDPSLIEEGARADQERGYQAFDDALMGAMEGVDPDAALTQWARDLQANAAGEDVPILPDLANEAADFATRPWDATGISFSRERPWIRLDFDSEGRPLDDAIAGMYMNAQDIFGAARQSDLLGPWMDELTGEDRGFGARMSPEAAEQEAQARLENMVERGAPVDPSLTGARDLREVPIDPVQYRMLAEELGYPLSRQALERPDPALWRRMLGELERRRTGGDPREAPPAAQAVPARASLPPAQQELYDDLATGFVPPEQAPVDDMIRQLIENDEVAHPRGQRMIPEPANAIDPLGPNGSPLGRWDGALLFGATPAEGGVDPSTLRPALPGEMEAEAAATGGGGGDWWRPGLGFGETIDRGLDIAGDVWDQYASPRLKHAARSTGDRITDAWQVATHPGQMTWGPTAEAFGFGAEAEDFPVAEGSVTPGDTPQQEINPGDFNASRAQAGGGSPDAGLADNAAAAEEELNWINRQLRDRFGMDASERAKVAQSMIRFGTTMASTPGGVLEGFNAGAGAALDEWQGISAAEAEAAEAEREWAYRESQQRARDALESLRGRTKLDEVNEMASVLIEAGYTPDEAIAMAERYAGVRSESAWAGGNDLGALLTQLQQGAA